MNLPVDVVYYSGTRRSIDVDGNVTRDSIVWNGDGSGLWSQVWIIWQTGDLLQPGFHLVTEDGDALVTEDGDTLISEGTVPLPDEVLYDLRLVPREWTAAHILRTWLVLLYGSGELWDYPQPMGDWDEWEDPTMSWDEDAPVVVAVEA
jgi:hypothetical protein